MRNISFSWIKEQSCYLLLTITGLVGSYFLIYKKLVTDLGAWENSQPSLNGSSCLNLTLAPIQKLDICNATFLNDTLTDTVIYQTCDGVLTKACFDLAGGTVLFFAGSIFGLMGCGTVLFKCLESYCSSILEEKDRVNTTDLDSSSSQIELSLLNPRNKKIQTEIHSDKNGDSILSIKCNVGL